MYYVLKTDDLYFDGATTWLTQDADKQTLANAKKYPSIAKLMADVADVVTKYTNRQIAGGWALRMKEGRDLDVVKVEEYAMVTETIL